MTLKRESIIAALTAALASCEGVSGRIWRSRVEAIQRMEAPAIVIEPDVDQPSAEQVSTCKIDHRLQVTQIGRAHV